MWYCIVLYHTMLSRSILSYLYQVLLHHFESHYIDCIKLYLLHYIISYYVISFHENITRFVLYYSKSSFILLYQINLYHEIIISIWIQPHDITLCQITWYHIPWNLNRIILFMSYSIVVFYIRLYHIIAYHIILYSLMLFHVISLQYHSTLESN